MSELFSIFIGLALIKHIMDNSSAVPGFGVSKKLGRRSIWGLAVRWLSSFLRSGMACQ
jgi:hypothetical protein